MAWHGLIMLNASVYIAKEPLDFIIIIILLLMK